MKNIAYGTILIALLSIGVILVSCTPSIPHTLEGKKECITCHGQNGVKPFPDWHAKHGYGNTACADCHEAKTKGL